jgi:DNA glycosylase AlkZ-like
VRITDEQRRARLGRRHRLAAEARATDVVDVARDLVGLHATDPSSVFIAAAARMKKPSIAAVERALYEDRSLVRVLGMRRTLFVEPVDLVPVVYASSTIGVAARNRAAIEKDVVAYGVADDGGAWLRAVEEETYAALVARGQATGSQLSADVPLLRIQVRVGEGKPWEGFQGLTTRVLTQLGADGLIVRGRPRGSWTSTQHTWTPMATWLGAELPALAPDEARVGLARRWLRSFGPATVADLRWWTGWTAGDVKRALATIDPVEVELDDGATGVVLADDTATARAPKPWAALLPALDPTAMGWTGRRWYVGPHTASLFDRSGNIGPTVWWCGRIVGGWGQRPGGEVVVQLLEDVGADAVKAIDREATRLAAFLGGVRITPRFRTPLERELGTATSG